MKRYYYLLFLIIPIFCINQVSAYSFQQIIPSSQFSFQYYYSPAGSDPGQQEGFYENHPIRYNSVEWNPETGIIHCQAYVEVPKGVSQAYRPNVNITSVISYNGSFSNPFSYIKIKPNININVISLHKPPSDMGFVNYSYYINDIKLSGNKEFSIDIAYFYVIADYWYSNNEVIHDYASIDIEFSIKNVELNFYCPQLDINAFPTNAWKGQNVQFIAIIKDGVPPYTIQWYFDEQYNYTEVVYGNIGDILTSYTYFAFQNPGLHNVTCKVIDSMGINDAKWILVNVSSVYLNIETTLGGTTNPSPGLHEYSIGEKVNVYAYPSSGYALDKWELDGITLNSNNPISIIMNSNHTLKAIFTQELTVNAYSNVTYGEAPLPVQFYCIASGGNPPYSFLWNFGDMGISNEQNPIHVYSQPGKYNVVVTVSDSMGRKGYAYINIYVNSSIDFIIYKSNDIFIKPGELGTSIIYVNSNQIIPIQLSIEWIEKLPINSCISIIPQSVITNGSSLLTFLAGDSIGIYTCRVIGRSGNLSHYVDVYINITQQIYYLNIESSEGGITNPPTGLYAYPAGTIVTISAIPNSDYLFDKWQLNGNDYSSNDIISITMNSNYTLKAVFKKKLQYQSSIIFDIRYPWYGSWMQGDYSEYGLICFNNSIIAPSSPYTLKLMISNVENVPIYFDPMNLQGKLLSQWGGESKVKIYSAYYIIGNNEFSISSIMYPSYYEAILIPSQTHILRLNIKLIDFPVNITSNRNWGYVIVESNSPSWFIYNYSNGFGVYYVDYSYNIKIKAYPYAGYYFDKIVINPNSQDEKILYDNIVTIENITKPYNVIVYFSANPPTSKLIIKVEGNGTTIPAPGIYEVPRYSYQSIIAYTNDPNYYFSNWIIDGKRVVDDSKINIYMDSDHEVTAIFDTDIIENIGPASLKDGRMLKRVILYENIGINVTVRIPGILSPTQVNITAWLDPLGVLWWDKNSCTFKSSIYKFTKIVTTDSSGYISILFGSLDDVFYSTNRNASIGSKYFAYAEIRVSDKVYYYNSTWKIDNIMATAEFDYNLTGINATFKFRYLSDGSLVKGREGFYSATLDGIYEIWNGSLLRERFSSPCDENGFSYLWIPYSWLNNSILRAEIPINIYSYENSSLYPITYAIRNNITYTVIAPMFYFINSDFIVLEPFDWGDRNKLSPIEGSYAYIYSNDINNGTIFGPSKSILLYRSHDKIYMNFSINSSFLLLPIRDQIKIPMDLAQIKGILINISNVKNIWLQIIPGHSVNILYNPIKEGRKFIR